MDAEHRAFVERLGRALASRRQDSGLSQESVAERSGLHRTYVGSIERGERNPTVWSLVRLAGGVGADPADILTEALG